MQTLNGYDGSLLIAGDRVELHPGCDLWMRGARFGSVVTVIPETKHVRVQLDKVRAVRYFHCTRVRRV